MKINEIIRKRRKEIGLTQEQIATYLGVTTPAVNKWERGSTYPDIALLPVLARLLKVDLNELFSFNEELTEFEISAFGAELVETAQKKDLNAAFQKAMGKIREYPGCDNLVYSVAIVMEGCLFLMTADNAAKKKYEQQIIAWYEQAACSQNITIKNSATYMLAKKYIKIAAFEKAKELFDTIPENNIDKADLQVDLLLYQEKSDDAAAFLEQKLLKSLSDLQMLMLKLLNVEMITGNEEKAVQIADIAEKMVPLFGLWGYSTFVPKLQLYLYRKDVGNSIAQLKKLFGAIHTPWNSKDFPLYYRITDLSFIDIENALTPALLADLENSKEYDFLRSNEEFQNLLAALHKKADA